MNANGWRYFLLKPLLLFLLIFGAHSILQASSSKFSYDPYRDHLGHDKLGQVGTRSLFYLNSEYQNPEARSVQLFDGRITREAEEGEFSLGIDLEGQFSVSQQLFNSFTANEFYFRMDPLWSGATLYMGRRRSHWSSLDDRWKLGVWQPVYKLDSLNPHTQGLTGLFVAFKQTNWNLEFFATPFFLPDHGPQVETRNGQFVKGHPWVQYPPSQLLINNEKTSAFYRIDKPSIPDVIANTGYGMNFQWGEEGRAGWLGRAAVAYKPMNQLLIGFNGNLNIADEGRVDIDVHPEVGFHRVASLDGAYRWTNWGIYLGVIQDTPDIAHFDSPWTYQNFQRSQVTGGGIEYFTDFFRMGLGYIHHDGGESRVMGPRSNLSSQVLPERFLFKDLVKTELKYIGAFGPHWSYELSGEYRYELNEKSEIISTQGALLIGPFWKAYVGVDLLRTDNGVKDKVDFVELYQSNDRLFGGVQYVF